MNYKLEILRKKFQAMSLIERQVYIKSLSYEERLNLYNYPELFLYDKQLVSGNQRYTIFRCGRGFGKTFTGSAWVARKVLDGAKSIGLIGPTKADIESVMVKDIIAWFPPGEAKYIGGDQKLIRFTKYPNTTIYCYSAETEIRGPNLEYLWCDEIVKWNDKIPEKVQETFSTADFAVRIGKNPQTLITSTPKPFPLFFKWQKKIDEGNPLYKMYTGTLFDNPFLSESYRQSIIEEHPGREGRQEIYGDLLMDIEGAAWTHEMIDNCHLSEEIFTEMLTFKTPLPDFKAALTGIKTPLNQIKPFSIQRIVVSVDPTVSDKPDTDECGIIIAALGSDDHAYILADRSNQMTTAQWAQAALKALKDFRAGMIVIEDNNGGELVKKNILSLDPSAPIKAVKAVKGKIDRALPAAALYERGLVHHIISADKTNPFEKLEKQMLFYTGNPKQKSPDRLDALVWSLYELKLSKTYANRDLSAVGYF